MNTPCRKINLFKALSNLVLLLYIGVFASCLTELEVDLPMREEDDIVVSGYIEEADSFYYIKVYVANTFPFGPIRQDPQIAAEIELLMNGIPIMGIRNNVIEKVRVKEIHDQFGSSPRQANFKINVKTLGETYTSEPVRIINNPRGSEYNIKIDVRETLSSSKNIVEKTFVQLQTTQNLVNQEGESVSQLWNVKGAYLFREISCGPLDPVLVCYVEDFRGTQYTVFEGSSNLENTIKEFIIDEVILDYRFNREYYYTITLKSLNPAAARYWSQVRNSLSRSGSIFDSPAGKVTSNIRAESGNLVNGYFNGSQVDTFRLKVDAVIFDEAPRAFCVGKDVTEYMECCDCQLRAFSTLTKPHYWK